VDFTLTPELEAFRKEVSDFLDKEGPADWHERRVSFYNTAGQENWIKTYREMAEKLGAKGWLSLHWPKEYGGQDASPFCRLIVREEITRHHATGYDSIGAGIVAPAILLKGTEEQKKEHLPGIAQGKVIWCETLSEPGHGSDLANIEVFAREDEDCYVVNGQKIWTTHGHLADWNALVARTDREVTPKYRGITMFLVDMKTPGITVNPVINMAGHHEFNEVFFDDVHIPKENIVGGKNQGFYVVMSLLDYERTSDPIYAFAEVLLKDLIGYAQERDLLDSLMKNRLAQLLADCEVARLLHYRVTWMQSQGLVPNYESAMSKLYSAELHQRVTEAGMQLLGHYSQLTDKSDWVPMYGMLPSVYLRSIGNSLEQGTSEIDRDVIAQRGLDLPRLR
jgi:alkylation response protein AidB-like acyl-CoA dehydrogenase